VSTLNTVQQEQLRAIGTYLNQVRQEQALSLEEISAKTYIPLRLLKAIETGQEQPLPEPVFVQGFIRRYADLLGLDGMELAQKFPVNVTPLPAVVTATAESRPRTLTQPSYLNSLGEEPELSKRPRLPKRSVSYLPYLAAAALLAIGGIGLAIVRAISSRPVQSSDSALVLPKQPTLPRSSISPSSPAGSPSLRVSPAVTASIPASPLVTPSVIPVPSSTPDSSRSPIASPTLSPSAADPNAPVSVEMQLTGDSWVQVTVDGVVKAEAVLPKGTRQSWSGRQQITILSGNAGAVSVAANGGPAKKMGALGDVTELTVKPK